MPSGSLITQLRNQCVAHFLSGGWTHLFFIDSDTGFSGSSFRRVLTSGYEVAAGICPFRSDDIQYQGGFAVDSAELGPIGDNGFATILHAGTGFMCIARSAIEKMSDAGIASDEFFDTMRDDEGYWTEDFAFCRRWRALGGTVHLDTESDLTHQGVKVFCRDFQKYLAERTL